MNQSEIANLLTTKPRQWKTSILRGENQPIRWLPIIDVSRKNFYLGLSEEGFWVADSRDKLLRLGKNGFFVPLLPILEQDYVKFLNHLKISLKKVGLPISIVSIFPWLETIICGLEQGSDYWATLALQWLESHQELQTVKLEPVLKEVSGAKWASQKVKQKSKRLLKIVISKPLNKKDKLPFAKAETMRIFYTQYLFSRQLLTSSLNISSHSFDSLQFNIDSSRDQIVKSPTNTVRFKSDRRIHFYNR